MKTIYGNDIRTVKRALVTGSVIGLLVLIAGIAAVLKKGDLSHARWGYLILVALVAPAALLAVTIPSTLFKIEVENGFVTQRIAGFIVSTALVTQFKNVSIGAGGPCLIFEHKRMHLIAMHLREVKRLSDDLGSMGRMNEP